jgi:hypothetical protein
VVDKLAAILLTGFPFLSTFYFKHINFLIMATVAERTLVFLTQDHHQGK